MDSSAWLTIWTEWGEHLSYAFFLACFLVTNMVGLRVLGALAYLTNALVLMASGDGSHLRGELWSLLFVAINVAQVVRIHVERRRTRLSAEERELRTYLFPHLGEIDFHYLLKASVRQSFAPGSALTQQGIKLDQLHVIVKGSAEVLVNNEPVARIGVGSLVGEVSFFRDKLRSLMDRRDSLRLAIHESIGKGLSEIVAKRL